MHTILLAYDLLLPEHQKFNTDIISQLKTSDQFTVLEVSSYLHERLRLFSICKYNPRHQQTQVSTRRKLFHFSKDVLKQLLHLKREASTTETLVSLNQLIGSQRIVLLRKMVARMSVQELINLEWNGIRLGEHACVDLSLDCKCTDQDIKNESAEHLLLRLLTFHACALLEALEILVETNTSNAQRFLSTSVYSLDWIAREFVRRNRAEHRFLIPLKLNPPTCRIYQTYCDDLILLRQQQEAIVITKSLLSQSCDYAIFYLQHRLSPSTVHRYSPLSSDLNLLSDLLAKSEEHGNIWTYYTNSPDELVSVNHGYTASKDAQSKMPWIKDAFVTNEEQCLWVVGKLAKASNALLVIRHHPRLQPEQRSPFRSSSYSQLSLVCERIRASYPDNIFILNPTDKINSYELAMLSDRVISFRGTMPLESSLLGIRPIVMAKDQGAMNYWILLHAQAAPLNEAELLYQLTCTSECYQPDELARFLCEFFLLQEEGSISLDAQSSKELLDKSLAFGSSRRIEKTHFSTPEKVGSTDTQEMIGQYLNTVRSILYDSFFKAEK